MPRSSQPIFPRIIREMEAKDSAVWAVLPESNPTIRSAGRPRRRFRGPIRPTSLFSLLPRLQCQREFPARARAKSSLRCGPTSLHAPPKILVVAGHLGQLYRHRARSAQRSAIRSHGRSRRRRPTRSSKAPSSTLSGTAPCSPAAWLWRKHWHRRHGQPQLRRRIHRAHHRKTRVRGGPRIRAAAAEHKACSA